MCKLLAFLLILHMMVNKEHLILVDFALSHPWCAVVCVVTFLSWGTQREGQEGKSLHTLYRGHFSPFFSCGSLLGAGDRLWCSASFSPTTSVLGNYIEHKVND